MAAFEQGDVVRVPFPYTDRSTRQHRPALIVSAGGIGESQGLLWVAMITSAENRAWPGDLSFGDTYLDAGLPAPSVIRTCKVTTIETRDADRLGRAQPALIAKVLDELRHCLGLIGAP